jgi:hypothetical protein
MIDASTMRRGRLMGKDTQGNYTPRRRKKSSILLYWDKYVDAMREEAEAEQAYRDLVRAVQLEFDFWQMRHYRSFLRSLFCVLFVVNIGWAVFEAETKTNFVAIFLPIKLICGLVIGALLWLIVRDNLYTVRMLPVLSAGFFIIGILIQAYLHFNPTMEQETKSGAIILYMFVVLTLTPIRVKVALTINVLLLLGTAMSFAVRKGEGGDMTGEFQEAVKQLLLQSCCLIVIGHDAYFLEVTLREGYVQQRQIEQGQHKLKEDEAKADDLLCSMMPKFLVEELKKREEKLHATGGAGFGENKVVADDFSEVSVLFCQIDKFDEVSSTLEANQIVLILNIIYTEFDKLIDKFTDGDKLRKVETVGAEYMVVGGAPERTSSHARYCALFAIALIRTMPSIRETIKLHLKKERGLSQDANLTHSRELAYRGAMGSAGGSNKQSGVSRRRTSQVYHPNEISKSAQRMSSAEPIKGVASLSGTLAEVAAGRAEGSDSGRGWSGGVPARLADRTAGCLRGAVDCTPDEENAVC